MAQTQNTPNPKPRPEAIGLRLMSYEALRQLLEATEARRTARASVRNEEIPRASRAVLSRYYDIEF